MRKIISVLAVLVTIISVSAISSQAEAISLVGNKSLYTDGRARFVGDLITVIINESTSTQITKNSSNGKEGSQSLNAGTGWFSFLPAVGGSQSDEFSATGSARNVNRISGRITVTVVEVTENGNFVIEGTQSIWQNNNEEKIVLRGIVRPRDISSDNTVLSSYISDATLKFTGKGPLNAKQRQGILTQIFNILF